MKVEIVPIDRLIGAEYNPRKITEKAVNDLKASIDKFGIVEPIVVNKHAGRENVIVGGHQRVNVLRLIGHTEVPVVYVDLDEAAEKELNVRLNKNGGEWDWEKLANVFDNDDLISWGFTKPELGMSNAPDEIDHVELASSLDSYLDGNIRQIVLYFDAKGYEEILKRLGIVMEREGCESHTEAFMKILEHYEGAHSGQ